MEGKENELENLMHGKSAKFIMENCPKNCTECCSFKDNNFMESLWHVLKLHENLEDVKFITHYQLANTYKIKDSFFVLNPKSWTV